MLSVPRATLSSSEESPGLFPICRKVSESSIRASTHYRVNNVYIQGTVVDEINALNDTISTREGSPHSFFFN